MDANRQLTGGRILGVITALFLLCLLSLALLSRGASGAALPASPSNEALSSGASAPPRVSTCNPLWMVVSSPGAGTNDNNLAGIAAISSSDIWAVGNYSGMDGIQRTLTEHWNGSTWSVVSSPSPSNNYNYLNGVTALASNNVWAVGVYSDPDATALTLVEHWNGSAWSVVSSANVDNAYNSLDAVAALTSNDIWAVGMYNPESGGGERTLTEHWNGSSWSVVPSPTVGQSYNDLDGVAVISPNDVWAVGSADTGTNSAVTEHWDGSTWSVVSNPGEGPLRGVVAIASNDVWAVGQSADMTLTEHWNGSAWSIVNSPSPGDLDTLNGVTALTSNNVWAVGTFFNGEVQTLTEHWNGKVWNVVSSPNVGTTHFNYLNGVAIVGSNDVWAVGEVMRDISGSNTLTEHYSASVACPWAGK